MGIIIMSYWTIGVVMRGLKWHQEALLLLTIIKVKTESATE